MVCPNCEKLLKEFEQAFCQSCGKELEWLSFEDYSEGPKETESAETIHQGNLKCNCGQTFYFETNKQKINCINCGKEYDASSFPK